MAGECGKSEWVVEMEERLNGMKPPPTTMEEEELTEGRKQWRRLYRIPPSIRDKVEGGIYEPNKDYWIGFLKDITATLMPINRAPRIEYMYNEFRNSSCILDVYRRCIIHRDFKGRAKKSQRRKPQEEFYSTNIPSATELNKAGIGFTTSDSTSILDVSLRRKTLRLPVIDIDDSTRSVFLNLIAFEQLHKDVAKNEVASYMCFMGCLVQVADDASLLQSRGIINAKMPPAEVAAWFNQMTKSFSLDHDDPLAPEFIEMFKTLRARYNKMSNEWRKDLFQNYLKSPWAIMSVFAGFVLLVLTTIQTVYAVLGYVRPK